MKNMPSRASEGERRGEQGERGNDDRGGDEKKNSTTTCGTTRLEKGNSFFSLPKCKVVFVR